MFLYFNFFLNIFHIVQNYYDRIVIKFLVKKFPIEISWKINEMTPDDQISKLHLLIKQKLLLINFFPTQFSTILLKTNQMFNQLYITYERINFFDIQQRYVNHACSLHFFFFFFALISLTSLSQLKSLHRSNFTNRIKSRNLSHILLNKFSLFNNRNQTRWIFPVLNETTKPPLARYIFISFFSLISFASLT